MGMQSGVGYTTVCPIPHGRVPDPKLTCYEFYLHGNYSLLNIYNHVCKNTQACNIDFCSLTS